MINLANDELLSNEIILKKFIDTLGIKAGEEFYLKIVNNRTDSQYPKLPNNAYLGMQDYERKECFLVRFKFLPYTYEFTSDCIYLMESDYKLILNMFLNSEFDFEKKEPIEPFYIQIIDNLNTYIYEEEEDEDYFQVKVFHKDLLNLSFKCINDIEEEELSPEAKFRKMLIEDVFQLNLDEEFYLKVYKPKTTLQYNKKLKEQYLGLKDYDMGVCFLIKFKFKNKNYELYSTCKYLSQEFYEDILLKMIAGQYIITKNINYKNRVSIYIIDNISIYKLDYDEDKAKLDEILSYQIDQELDLLTPKNEETG